MTRLLAKSFARKAHGNAAPPEWALLTRHSRDVAEACRTLAHLVGPAALRAFGLPEDALDRFTTALTLCGWIQDLGKANSHFQDMVSGNGGRQMLRHEVVSALLVWYRLRDWLHPLDHVLVPALWAALGHHRKLGRMPVADQGSALTVHLRHGDFADLLAGMARDLGLDTPPAFGRDLCIERDVEVADDDLCVPRCTQDMIRAFRRCEHQFAALAPRRELALLKSFGIAADVAASAIPTHAPKNAPYSVAEVIAARLASGVTSMDMDALVRAWAWKHVAHRDDDEIPAGMPPGFIKRGFQTAVEKSDSLLTLAEAGCGSGKSLAAYLWAGAWCRRREADGHGPMQLFVCLPTTGTATEHFKDYGLHLGVLADLAHSRAAVDIAEIHRTTKAEDQEGDETPEEAAVRAERQKIDALSLWGVPVVVSTVDSVLGALAHGLKSLCTFPAVVRSLLVFDEIHAFDDRLFGHLLVLLRHAVGIPILLMTASLPESRRRAIEAVRPDLRRIPGPADLQELKRYRITVLDAAGDPWPEVERCLARGGKVLWVRNRVDWANETYHQARTRFPHITVDVYHSRLRYGDRTHRHRKVIDAFKRQDGKPVLLVSTQVAEMSLDLSADLLVTDMAPIPALIQRMGRLNRRATTEEPGTPALALICPITHATPYEQEALGRARDWASALVALGHPLCQNDLAEHFARLDGGPDVDLAAAERNACLFGVPEESGLWRTEPGQTRDAGYTASVILKADLAAHGRTVPNKAWLRAHEVAIPIRSSMFGWNRVSGIPIAPTDEVEYDYDPDTREGTGARWRTS